MDGIKKGAEQSYKSEHGAVSYWLGNVFVVEISDPKQAYPILKYTLNKKHIHEVARHLIGNGTVFAPAHEWFRRRKILAPIFTPRYINGFVKIFDKQSRNVIKQIDKQLEKGTNITCWDYICAFTFDSICETALGINLNRDNVKEHPIMNVFFDYVRANIDRLVQPWLQNDTFYQMLPKYTIQENLKNNIHEFFDALIYEKKMLLENGKVENDIENDIKIFLELMMESSKNSDKEYTYEELREEILVLAIAGTDTSATAASFIMVMLSQHLDIQEKVYQELIEVFGDSDGPIQFEDLHKVKYLEAVIKETIRLYPPVPILTRDITRDIELPSGIILPKDTITFINIWGIHHNPHYWGDDANEFNPDRFISRAVPEGNVFMPFSFGPRNCIGNHYAMLSLKTVLSNVLRQYRILPATSFIYDKRTPLRVTFEIMMKHVHNFEIQLQNRN